MPQSLLNIIADNPKLLEELKEVIFKRFLIDFNLNASNEMLGAVTRARLDGRKLVEDAFREIETHRSVKDNEEEKNPAR